MPENAPRRKHQQHGGMLLRKEVVTAIREQAAPRTPAPTWKLYENPSYRTVAAAAMVSAACLMEHEEEEEEEVEDDEEDKQQPEGKAVSTCKFLSARKLAASLWDEFQEEGQRDSPVVMSNFLESSPCSHLQPRPSSLSNSESPDSLSYHHSSKIHTRTQHISKSSPPLSSPSPPLKAIMLTSEGSNLWSESSATKAANFCPNPSRKDPPEEHKSLDGGSIAPLCDYIKASSRFSLESTLQDNSLVESTYSKELNQALSRVQQVEAAQISARKELEGLLRRCADEITMLRTKEQEKIQAAVLSIAEELEVEREARKSAEMESKRLANSIADANNAVVGAEKELEKERKSRQLMEDVCNELAKEIGEDKTEVEELKRELARVRDEIEEERKMLHVTEAWREERVQMKLSEAKLELEERCVALDRLKGELESFLNKQRGHRAGRRGKSLEKAIKRLQEDTSKSAFFQDARFPLSPDDDALSSSISSSRPNAWSNNGIKHAYISKYKKQSVYFAESNGSDLDWNVDSRGFTRKTCNWSEFPNGQLNEQRIHYLDQASSRRRNEVNLRSYQSKSKELSSLGGRDLGDDSANNSDRNRAGINDSGSQGKSLSDCNLTAQDEDQENAEAQSDTGDQGGRDAVLWSASGEELESSTCNTREVSNMKGRQDAARSKQLHCGQGAAGKERRDYGFSHSKYRFSRRRNRMLATDHDCEFSSITGYSPASKGHMPSPDLPMRKPSHIVSPSKHSALLEKRAVYRSADWLKPYKKSSLQVKLLLEDKLFQ